MSSVILRISAMNVSRSMLPRSISLSLCSQSPVNSGFDKDSTCKPFKSVMSENACAVGINSRASRTIYLWRMSSSIMFARVAGVPKPDSRIASRNSSSSTSLPAPSIALSSVASVKRAGGRVSLASASTSVVLTSSPSATAVNVSPC